MPSLHGSPVHVMLLGHVIRATEDRRHEWSGAATQIGVALRREQLVDFMECFRKAAHNQFRMHFVKQRGIFE